MATNIDDVLPNEMITEILEKIDLPEVVLNTSKTSPLWRNLIAQSILKPKILTLASQSWKFNSIIQAKGWTGTDDDTELILSLYHTYAFFSSK